MKTADMVVEQMKTLPDALAYEVLDFIGYLKQRTERLENTNMINAQQASLANVWVGEPEDAWNASESIGSDSIDYAIAIN